jgi:Fe-S oxidoreductase
MLARKRDSIEAALPDQQSTVIATNCPSCISGLGRNRDLGIVPRHMAVILAEACGGSSWRQEFSRLANGAEKVTY